MRLHIMMREIMKRTTKIPFITSTARSSSGREPVQVTLDPSRLIETVEGSSYYHGVGCPVTLVSGSGRKPQHQKPALNPVLEVGGLARASL